MEAGQTLADRYQLEERLGEGGMSVVWRAYDSVLGRRVAIKLLANESVTMPAYRESIRTDAQAAASLSHPNVAGVFDYGEYIDNRGESVPYVVMELLRGRSLAERLLEGPLDPASALRVCAQVAGALAAAHALGLVHRDVKPGNVMLTPGGAKMFDFGIAASVGQLDDADPDSPILGTAAYLAPERLAGAPVTAASDVYALALLLFRTLTNVLPWSAQTVTEMIMAHAYVEPDPLPRIEGVPSSVRKLAERCLAKEPSERPSAREAAVVLAAAAGIAPVLGDQEDPGVPAASPTPVARQGLRSVFAVAVAVVLLLAAILVAFVRDDGHSPDIARAAPPAAPTTTADRDGGPTQDPQRQPTGSGVGNQADPAPPGGPTVPGPTSATGPAATAAPTQPPPNSPERTFTSSGGSVVATCQGADAYLVSWRPEPGYRAQQVRRGPADEASLVFHMASEKATITVACVDGVPTGTVTTK